MRWQIKSLAVTLLRSSLLGAYCFIISYAGESPLAEFFCISGCFLVLLGMLHFYLNTIIESLRGQDD